MEHRKLHVAVRCDDVSWSGKYFQIATFSDYWHAWQEHEGSGLEFGLVNISERAALAFYLITTADELLCKALRPLLVQCGWLLSGHHSCWALWMYCGCIKGSKVHLPCMRCRLTSDLFGSITQMKHQLKSMMLWPLYREIPSSFSAYCGL